MTPQDSIPIHVATVTPVDISHTKRSKFSLLNKQDSTKNNAIIKLFQDLYVRFK